MKVVYLLHETFPLLLLVKHCVECCTHLFSVYCKCRVGNIFYMILNAVKVSKNNRPHCLPGLQLNLTRGLSFFISTVVYIQYVCVCTINVSYNYSVYMGNTWIRAYR
jgi:hypothetical protein